MAEHPDITLIKRGYEAFNNADVATLSEIIAADAQQHMVGDNLVSGDYKGVESILGFYGRLAELTNGTYGVDIESMFTDGEGKVVVIHNQRGERNGTQLTDAPGADLHGRRRQDRRVARHHRGSRGRRRVLGLSRTTAPLDRFGRVGHTNGRPRCGPPVRAVGGGTGI